MGHDLEASTSVIYRMAGQVDVKAAIESAKPLYSRYSTVHKPV